jgi:hypothetical protein
MKIGHLLALFCLVGCNSLEKKSAPTLKIISASYQIYHSGPGRGHGVIFKISPEKTGE